MKKHRELNKMHLFEEMQTANGLKQLPRQARSEQLIESICESTLAILDSRGVAALNTNLIAKTAGVPVASLYRFFPDKTAILRFIISRWMQKIRKTWDRFESDEELLRLDWREYFIALFNAWQSDSTQKLYCSFSGVWNFFPELHELDVEHREYFAEFLVRQMRRFGAKESPRYWRDLALFLYIVEDEVHASAATKVFSSLEVGRTFFLEAALNQLGKLLRPTAASKAQAGSNRGQSKGTEQQKQQGSE